MIIRLNDELRQIEFYRKKLERLDSYLIKVAATMSHTHSKVLQIGVSGDLQDLEEDFFRELEDEAQALGEVLQATDQDALPEAYPAGRDLEEHLLHVSFDLTGLTTEEEDETL